MENLLKLPKVSFVVTSYNYERFITKTLNSIKAQTYKNFEIIIVDDKSSDNSISVIEDFVNSNPDLDIKFIKKAKNEGQMSAIFTGLKEVKGQFVSFIDSDDILIKDYAECHIKTHLKCSVAVTSSQLLEIGENDELHTTYSIASFQKKEQGFKSDIKDLDNIDSESIETEVLTLKEAPFGGWYWSPMSANMFRVETLMPLLFCNISKHWKICPDKFLLNYAHLIGGSALIYMPLCAYRRHSANVGETSQVLGNKRYNSNKTTIRNIKNNLQVRIDMFKFLSKNLKELNTKFGIRGIIYFYKNVLIFKR